MQDVDEGKLLAYQHAFNADFYQAFVNNTFELILHTSMQGAIISTNELFIQNFGYAVLDELKMLSVSQLLVDAGHLFTELSGIENTGRLTNITLDFKRKDGSILKGKANILLIRSSSDAPHLLWTILNVTDQFEIESQLKKQNDQLAKVNHQMEKFLYSASHDLRSPISSILGLTHLMKIESKDKTAVDYIDKVESCAIKLDKIIRSIIAFSKTSYQRMNSERINFESLVWSIFRNYNDNTALKRINIDIQVKNDLIFYSDSERLEIILDHLIQNAINFYDTNKTRSFILFKVQVDHEYASIEIADNGIGIGSQHLDHIFTMFYKASHLSKGAGLGLYIVKEAVMQLNGNIKVESEIGFGTVFRIIIPQDNKGKLVNRKIQLQSSKT
jgi:PAS domain S-box-containing protein